MNSPVQYDNMKKITLFYFGLMCILAACVNESTPKSNVIPVIFKPKLDTLAHIRNYELLQEKIKRKKTAFRRSPTEAHDYFFEMLNDSIFGYWMQTPWNFNGHTDTPRKGEIACGYFVTTTLRDIGVRLQRYKLAQQAASVIVEKLCEPTSMKRLASLEKLNNYLENRGEREIYILGLDYHVGFVIREGGESYFVHSDYIGSSGVKREKLNDSRAIHASESYVIGSLTANEKLLKKWQTR